MKTRREDITPYVTKDGSLIRELMHPAVHPARAGGGRLSLAEAVVEPGAITMTHAHDAAEEIYHFTAGRGRMTLGGDDFPVGAGDTVRIAPGLAHGVRNDGDGPLVFLCCCSPPYSHDDTRPAGEEGTP